MINRFLIRQKMEEIQAEMALYQPGDVPLQLLVRYNHLARILKR